MLVLGAEKERNVCVGTSNLERYTGTELGIGSFSEGGCEGGPYFL